MNPKVEELVQKGYYLRLTLQQSQDIVDGLESFVSSLEEDDAEEVEQTLLDVLQQLSIQGVAHNRE